MVLLFVVGCFEFSLSVSLFWHGNALELSVLIFELCVFHSFIPSLLSKWKYYVSFVAC